MLAVGVQILLLLSLAWANPANLPHFKEEIPSSSLDVAAGQLSQLALVALQSTMKTIINQGKKCTLQTTHVRRNWRNFTRKERRAYIKSVLCLQKLPSRTPPNLAPGARTRYDDFVATHINQTDFIHRSGLFLAWHRYYIYEFEQSLHNECDYTGDYPYWDWGADVDDLEKSPVFDGSDTSLSGNGAYIPNSLDITVPISNYTPAILPPGTGGGCVTSGPFVNYTVNMGPSYLSVPGGDVIGVAEPLNYNPRCMSRDLTSAVLKRRYANYTSIMNLILKNQNILDFETYVQGKPGTGTLGVHGGGHYAMGGDPGRDADNSPADPGFWHHHGMIDRVWWIWQNLDLKTRQYAIAGTGTFLNQPASPNITLDTLINIGYVNGNQTIAMGDIMSTTDGPFCYVYM
ncbi:uncharacterized protein N7459_008776 [Penicillium hispanicum]|uniref:uncharacterized protein n=1 Tax=Penicillium hispanicum TaxID=1080232 RepID=UPI00253F989A|nr:uncharacterized protein N7459_008776 [Penicillium hispanicum]KAJ5574349.1 hypothetical protein N7459_008776 [Penicillium hispanicum]